MKTKQTRSVGFVLAMLFVAASFTTLYSIVKIPALLVWLPYIVAAFASLRLYEVAHRLEKGCSDNGGSEASVAALIID